jgi:hypothetical protein
MSGQYPHIQWLKEEYELDDPFLEQCGKCPIMTTKTSGRDIDYILTHKVPISAISTIAYDIPANSDHLGLLLDIDIATLFGSTYNNLSSEPIRQLTTDNIRAKTKYWEYIYEQFEQKEYHIHAIELLNEAHNNTSTMEHHNALQVLDSEITQTLLTGESQCNTRKAS